MLATLLQAAGVFVASIVVALLRLRLARRRREGLTQGEVAVVRARLGMGREGKLRPGRLVMIHGSAGWYGRRTRGPVVLDGAVVLSNAPSRGWSSRQGDVVARVVLPSGDIARIQLFEGDAATLADVVADRKSEPRSALPPFAPPRSGWWVSALSLLALGVLALYAAMAFSATTIPATVVRVPGSATCDVTYLDSKGHVRAGEVDCLTGRPGELLTVWRFSDDPDDVEQPIWQTLPMLGIAAVLAIPAGWRLVWVRRRRRQWAEAAEVRRVRTAANRDPPRATGLP